MKGLIAKAEEGGTPFRAPLGYRNRREVRDGIEYSWVDLDPERAELVRWCLEQYATGDWSALDLTLTAQDMGLTSRPSPKRPAKPISLTGMYHLLQNPYHTGEKDRIHTHYLRGTIYCSDCGGRLVFSQHKGNGGVYDYFLCLKKKTKANNCTRRAVRVDSIEDGVATFYGSFQIPAHYTEQIAATVREELAVEQRQAAESLARARAHKQSVEDERRKLLQARYAGVVPQDLLGTEMKRLTRALAQAEGEIASAQVTTDDLASDLDAALRAAQHCERAYLSSAPRVRRLINQGFFKKLFIGEDGSVERAELQEPFAALLSKRYSTSNATGVTISGRTPTDTGGGLTAMWTGDTPGDRQTAGAVFTATYGVPDVHGHTKNPGEDIFSGVGVKETYLVGLTHQHTNRSVLVEGPEITIRPVGTRRLT